jgi:hypothetical protein
VTVKISYDARRTRLHAEAWLFHRATGFGTAFVGSANISNAALIGGLEWTVKFTQAAQADLYVAAQAQFESLWNDPEFELFDPNSEAALRRLSAALLRGRPPGRARRSGLTSRRGLPGRDAESPHRSELAPRNLLSPPRARERRRGGADYRAPARKVGSRAFPCRAPGRDSAPGDGDLLAGAALRHSGRWPRTRPIPTITLLRLDPERQSRISSSDSGRTIGIPWSSTNAITFRAVIRCLARRVRPKFLLGLTATPLRGRKATAEY